MGNQSPRLRRWEIDCLFRHFPKFREEEKESSSPSFVYYVNVNNNNLYHKIEQCWKRLRTLTIVSVVTMRVIPQCLFNLVIKIFKSTMTYPAHEGL